MRLLPPNCYTVVRLSQVLPPASQLQQTPNARIGVLGILVASQERSWHLQNILYQEYVVRVIRLLC